MPTALSTAREREKDGWKEKEKWREAESPIKWTRSLCTMRGGGRNDSNVYG